MVLNLKRKDARVQLCSSLKVQLCLRHSFVFGPPRSGSVIILYGSFYRQAKKVRETLISSSLWLSFWLYENCHESTTLVWAKSWIQIYEFFVTTIVTLTLSWCHPLNIKLFSYRYCIFAIAFFLGVLNASTRTMDQITIKTPNL